MKAPIAKLTFFIWLGLLSCNEADPPNIPNHGVEIYGLVDYQEVLHGTEVTLNYRVEAKDGLSAIKIFRNRQEQETLQFSGEPFSEGAFSFTALITEIHDWFTTVQDTVEVVIFARDLDGDSKYKRALIKVLAP